MRTDAQIQQAVLHELTWDTRVTATHIGVTVDQGVVTLSGSVPSYAERLAAQEAAHRVTGVLDVANDLRVQMPGGLSRSDSELARAVRHALEWDVVVPDERLQSTVADGWVTLEGTVDFWHQREDAERAVRHLTGVRGVTNQITVSVPPVAAEDVRNEIVEALERRADRAARQIEVTVRGGTVTVAGPIHSLEERRAILGAVRGTPGVETVHDQLFIDLTTP